MSRCLKLWMVILLLAVMPEDGYCQKEGQELIDSLLQSLPKAENDTARMMLLDMLSARYAAVNGDEGIKYAQQQMSLAEQMGWEKGTADAYTNLGKNHDSKADFPGALEYYFKALKLNEKLGNKRGMIQDLNGIGVVFSEEHSFDKAIDYYLKEAKLVQEAGDKSSLAVVLGNLGVVYAQNGNTAKSRECFMQAKELNEALNDKESLSKNLSCLANLYGEDGDYSKAIAYHFRALRINEALGSKEGMTLCTGNIGLLYLSIVCDTARKVQPDSLIPDGKTALLEAARQYLERGVVLAKEISYLNAAIEFSQRLSEVYAKQGKYKEALDAFVQFDITKDTVYSSTNKEKISALENQRQIELRDKQLEIDKLAIETKRNERVFYIAGLILLLMVVVFSVRNYNLYKRSNYLLSEETKKADNLLLNILPAEVAEELKNKGRADARMFDNVTVMFTDFMNFTQAGERMTPQELIDELHTCFKVFDEITGRYKIEKIKSIGDSYLAVAGLPVADPLHAERMVNAAIEMNEYIKKRRQQPGAKAFEVRIGIHSGSVVAGIVGVKKFAYDIWGDTVNTASRIEENSVAGHINISQTTYELVKDKFACTYRGEIEAKNKGKMKMYFVSAIKKAE